MLSEESVLLVVVLGRVRRDAVECGEASEVRTSPSGITASAGRRCGSEGGSMACPGAALRPSQFVSFSDDDQSPVLDKNRKGSMRHTKKDGKLEGERTRTPATGSLRLKFEPRTEKHERMQ